MTDPVLLSCITEQLGKLRSHVLVGLQSNDVHATAILEGPISGTPPLDSAYLFLTARKDSAAAVIAGSANPIQGTQTSIVRLSTPPRENARNKATLFGEDFGLDKKVRFPVQLDTELGPLGLPRLAVAAASETYVCVTRRGASSLAR